MNTSTLNHLSIFGVPVCSATQNEMLAKISEWLTKNTLRTIFTPNVEQIMLAQKSSAFLSVLQTSDLNIPDSFGVVWAAQRLYQQKLQKTPGRLVLDWLIQTAADNKYSIFFLGGRGFTAYRAEQAVLEHFPEISIHSAEGYQNIQQPSEEEEAELVTFLQQTRPQILCVAFGAPWQEEWVNQHKALLQQVGVRVAIVVGGSLDVLAGNVSRVPAFFANHNLEWLFRLMQEPWRLRRQISLPTFVQKVWQEQRSQKKRRV